MGLLNYTTAVSAQKSIGEICTMLIAAKAKSIMQEFDGAGNPVAISFRIQTQFGELSFRLPMDVQKVHQVLRNQRMARKIPRRFSDDVGHARNVGWRILRHWLEAQVALIEVGVVKVEQVFLPYAQNASGQTLYEVLQENKFSGLALPAPNELHAGEETRPHGG